MVEGKVAMMELRNPLVKRNVAPCRLHAAQKGQCGKKIRWLRTTLRMPRRARLQFNFNITSRATARRITSESVAWALRSSSLSFSKKEAHRPIRLPPSGNVAERFADFAEINNKLP